ncbi:VanZ family protein [Streptomyces indonesiensis]
MRFAALASVPRILALGAGCSALVETAQYVLRLDRVSSVDDVLVNAAAPCWPRWRRAAGGALRPKRRRTSPPRAGTGRLSRVSGGRTSLHTSAICGAA